jgi:hypothetical protein
MATPRYYVTLRPDGRAKLRYWMANHTSILIREFPNRAAAEAEAERLNAPEATTKESA